MILTPEFLADLATWNAANKAARDEYRQHPHSYWAVHDAACAAEGCHITYKRQAAKAERASAARNRGAA